MIDQPTIDRILDAAQIYDVVSDFVTLRKRGVNYVGLCPFHDDKTPSFYVSPAKGLCKCFACGKGGNAVHFIMEHEQMSYPEALKYLAKKYGIEIKERELSSEEKIAQGGDAHEKYNFTPVNMEGREGLYCLGFFETKSHNGKDVNQMRIENIAGCELLKKEESVDDVLVVYCAKHPAHKFTTVVGWYKHATVFRHYQEAVFAPEDIQYYNAIANSSDCVLLPAGIRSRKVQWEVPRKSNGWAYGFGRANVWYASEEDSRLQDYLTRLVKQIDEYDGENWIDKYAK